MIIATQGHFEKREADLQKINCEIIEQKETDKNEKIENTNPRRGTKYFE